MTADVGAIIRAHLRNDANLTALVGDNLWFKVEPPSFPRGGYEDQGGYNPERDGPGIVFMTRGGGTDYSSALLQPSVQFRCFGQTEKQAYDVYLLLVDALQDQRSDDGCVLISRLETQGQKTRDGNTNFPIVFCAFRHVIYNL
jgi:hypothetical protein